MTGSSVDQGPLTEKDAVPFEQLPRETKEWVIAWEKTYERLGLTPEELLTFYRLLMKIRWGFSAAEIEDFSPKEKKCLGAFRHMLICQANRLLGNRRVPDPLAGSYMGGRRHKIPVGDHETIRSEVKRLEQEGMPKREALAQVREERELKASLKTLERICQDRHDL